jgi:hypothetical protein
VNPHAAARALLLEATTRALAHDREVVGAALVGSLGRGDHDDWSDIDLLVVVDDDPRALRVPPGSLHVPAPHNTRAEGDAFSVQHVVDGLPVHTDWYVLPRSLAAWPVDARPIVRADAVPTSSATFDELNADGRRGEPPELSEREHRAARLAMVPLQAKAVVRRGALHQLAEIADLMDDIGADLPADHVAATRRLLGLMAGA